MTRVPLVPRGHPNGTHHIPVTTTQPYKPVETYIAILDYQMAAGNLEFGAQIYQIKRTDVEAIAAELAAGKLALPAALPTAPGRVTPLDITVGGDQCYVLVQLAPGKAWQFRSTGPGVTTKFDYGDDNCEVRHHVPGLVDPKGAAIAPGTFGPGVDTCQMLSFGVVRRAPGERQKFNLHVELMQANGLRLEIMLDPDVPDDGSGIPLDFFLI